jgi:hypothetical protein
MSQYFQDHYPFPFYNPSAIFASYMDLAAFLLTLLVTLILAIGVKESSRMNNVSSIGQDRSCCFCLIILFILIFIIITQVLYVSEFNQCNK